MHQKSPTRRGGTELRTSDLSKLSATTMVEVSPTIVSPVGRRSKHHEPEDWAVLQSILDNNSLSLDDDNGEEGRHVFVAKLLSRRFQRVGMAINLSDKPHPRLVRDQSIGSVMDIDAILDSMDSGEDNSSSGGNRP